MGFNARLALILLSCCVVGSWTHAADKPYRVGILASRANPQFVDGIAKNLAQHGYTLGQNLVIEARDAGGKTEALPARAEELVKAGVSVIVTLGYPSAVAAKAATGAVPVVVSSAGDPVATGLAVSLGHPGGNLTGISDMAPELSVKRLDLLKEAVPSVKKVAMLWNADDAGMTTRYRAAETAAKALGVAVEPLGVREPDDFDAAFAAMTRDKPDGILMVTDVLTVLNRKKVFEFAATHQIPAIYEFDFLVRDGGLMSYGPDGKEVGARIADLVGRILGGAKPADLPFEQPTRFDFVINLKTAHAIGLSVPQALLARADDVIE